MKGGPTARFFFFLFLRLQLSFNKLRHCQIEIQADDLQIFFFLYRLINMPPLSELLPVVVDIVVVVVVVMVVEVTDVVEGVEDGQFT